MKGLFEYEAGAKEEEKTETSEEMVDEKKKLTRRNELNQSMQLGTQTNESSEASYSSDWTFALRTHREDDHSQFQEEIPFRDQVDFRD